MKDYISKKQIVDLREFLYNYCGLTCNWKGKMTHKRMMEFLNEKRQYVKKGIYGKISKEQKLKGDYIYVIDEEGKIIPYKNPLLSLNRLKLDLTTNNNVKKLEQIRMQILNSQGLTYDEYGNVITIEEAEKNKQRELELKREELLGRILDLEEAYYEKKAKTNRILVKTKTDYRYRRALW